MENNIPAQLLQNPLHEWITFPSFLKGLWQKAQQLALGPKTRSIYVVLQSFRLSLIAQEQVHSLTLGSSCLHNGIGILVNSDFFI